MDVISFFSFKGGVGRTALMTNLGAYWASQGKVVLLMDLDLAAPGLSYSLEGKIFEEKGRWMGMSDLLSAFYDQLKVDSSKIKLLPPHFLIRQVQFEDRKFKDAENNLFFIPAGQQHFSIERKEKNLHDSFQDVISTIPGAEPEEGEGLEQTAYRALGYYMKKHLEDWTVPSGPSKGKKIDYLLIDTRTGFEELIDLSLGYLADRMVLVSSLNDQNLRGLKMTLEALKEKRVPIGTFPVVVTVVFSPIPAAEDEQLFERMEKAQQIIAQALRFERSGQKEMAPKCFSIHYNQILSLQEKLLVLERPNSLYGKEVITIAHHLDNETKKDDLKDDVIRVAIRKSMKHSQPTRRLEDVPTIEIKSPIPKILLTNLPPWYWPLSEEDREEVRRNKILNELIPMNPNVEMNREALFSQLCWDAFIPIEEKRRIISALPNLSQNKIDLLIEALEENRYKLMVAGKNYSELADQILNLFLTKQREWSIFILKNEKAGIERFMSAPNEHIFPSLENWGKYWLFLAKESIILLNEKERSLQLIERASQLIGDKNLTAVEFLKLFDPREVTELQLKEAESIAKTVAPSELWLNFLMARNRIQKTPSDKEAAKELLKPLLESPPDNAKRCYEFAAFLLNKLPKIAILSEPILRKAIELDEKYAYPWNGLGNLLEVYSKRYNEAEAAYRKAIELNHMLPYPWNGLGNILSDHSDNYEEAEKAYRRAIELDDKYAHPWHGLGNLLHAHLNRPDESKSAYLKAIELDDKFAHPWNGLGYLLQAHFKSIDEAEAAYRKAIELDETFAPAWNSLGNLLKNHLNRYDEAEAAYRKAIESDGTFAPAWDGLGSLLKNHLNRYDEAEAAYRKAIELDDKVAYPWNGLGNLKRFAYSDCEEAIELFKHGLSLPESWIHSYLNMNLGYTYLLMGETVLGQEYLKTALNKFDNSREDKGNYLYLAVLMNDTNKIQKQLPITEKNSSTGNFYPILSLLYYKILSNDTAQIEEWKHSTLNAMGCYNDHYYMMYNLYCLAGLRPEAKEHASRLVAELLTFPEELTSKFKDVRKPDSWYERYRPFAEGKSHGLGDPADRHLFCKCKSEKE